MQNGQQFGALLRASRVKAGWTLARLAEHLGVSVPYLSEVERFSRAPLTADRARAAAEALGVDPVEFQKAAAVSRGSFSLKAGPTPLHVEVAAALAAMWLDLSVSDLNSIALHCAAARARARRARRDA